MMVMISRSNPCSKNFAKYIVSKINIVLTKFFFDRKMDFRVRKSYSWSGSRTPSIAVGIGLKKKAKKVIEFQVPRELCLHCWPPLKFTHRKAERIINTQPNWKWVGKWLWRGDQLSFSGEKLQSLNLQLTLYVFWPLGTLPDVLDWLTSPVNVEELTNLDRPLGDGDCRLRPFALYRRRIHDHCAYLPKNIIICYDFRA